MIKCGKSGDQKMVKPAIKKAKSVIKNCKTYDLEWKMRVVVFSPPRSTQALTWGSSMPSTHPAEKRGFGWRFEKKK